MSEFIKVFEERNKAHFLKYKRYIDDNDWTVPDSESLPVKYVTIKDIKNDGVVTHEGKEGEYDIQHKIVKSIIGRLKYFVKGTEDEPKSNRKVKSLIKTMRDIITVHLNRVDSYISTDNIFDEDEILQVDSKKTEREFRSDEIEFDNKLYQDQSKISDELRALNLDEKEDLTILELYRGDKAPLIMRELIENEYPEVKEKVKSLKIDFDSPPKNEMLIHMDPNKIPEWNPNKHYFEQDKKTLQFYVDELKKAKRGIIIDGVYIPPWLYTHLNIFVTNIPTVSKNEITGEKEVKDSLLNPPLRDNEWFMIIDNYYEAKKTNQAVFFCAARRLAKTTSLASLAIHTVYEGGLNLIIAGSNDKDLSQIEENFKVASTKCNPAFRLPIITDDWSSRKVKLGLKKKSGRDLLLSTLHIINMAGGQQSSSEILAGFTPDLFVLDECMKMPFLNQYRAAKKAFETVYGYRLTPILSGCVCAGTKVWNNEGNLVNIEDLQKEEGILGFDVDNRVVTQENITYWQPPTSKPCYRITTNKGRVLQCSEDHPILYRSRNRYMKVNGENIRKVYFKETKYLEKGDHIIVTESVPFEGKNVMWEPRLVGLLIGDGNYKNRSPRMASADKVINEYLYENFDCVKIRGHKTKDGRDYVETRIRGIMGKMAELGIGGQSRCDKTLPLNMHSYRNEDIYEFLGGLFDADGHVSYDNKNSAVHLSSACENLLLEVLILLQKIGIHCTINFHKPRITPNRIDKNGHYVLTISDRRSVLEFYDKIYFMIEHKQEKLKKVVERLRPRREKIPREFKNERLEIIKDIEYIGIKPVYNLTAGNTNTYIANGIITHNTGSGNDALVKDAKMLLNNPAMENIFPMPWDKLERGINKEDITWKRRNFATFLPGQMSGQDRMYKIEKTLPEYLGIEPTEALNQIKIMVTDWENNKVVMAENREKLKSDTMGLVKEKAYSPFDPEEIFLSGKVNPFPINEIQRWVEALKETGDVGKKVVLDYGKNGEVDYTIVDKEYAPMPFPGGFWDAPVTIFQDPLPNATFEFCVAGTDDYKQEQSDSDSVGSFVVIRRDTGEVVATYHSRPNPHSFFHKQGLLLLEMYKSPTFMENEDMGFKEFTDRMDKTDEYVVESVNLMGNFTMEGTGRRTYGWTPTTKNKSFFMGIFIRAMNEQEIITDESTGKKITRWGFQKIKDLRILQEMIEYQEGKNVDSIVAAMSAYAYDYYLTVNYGAPQRPISEEERLARERALEEKRNQPKRKKLYPGFGSSMYSSNRRRNRY